MKNKYELNERNSLSKCFYFVFNELGNFVREFTSHYNDVQNIILC